MTVTITLPELRTPRLTLRPFRPADWDTYATLNADPAFRQFLGSSILTREQSWAQMETALGQWILRGYGLFAVEHQGTLIGRVGLLHPADWPEPELAWGIAPAYWGAGLATEAAQAVRTWGFDSFRFPHLASFIMPGNHRSVRVAEKLGALRNGTVVIRGLTADRWEHPAPGTPVPA